MVLWGTSGKTHWTRSQESTHAVGPWMLWPPCPLTCKMSEVLWTVVPKLVRAWEFPGDLWSELSSVGVGFCLWGGVVCFRQASTVVLICRPGLKSGPAWSAWDSVSGNSPQKDQVGPNWEQGPRMAPLAPLRPVLVRLAWGRTCHSEQSHPQPSRQQVLGSIGKGEELGASCSTL